MKDIVISYSRIKKELITLIACFFIGFTINIGAIIIYKTSYVELVTSLPYVFISMFVIYLIWSLLRIVKWLIFNFTGKNKKVNLNINE